MAETENTASVENPTDDPAQSGGDDGTAAELEAAREKIAAQQAREQELESELSKQKAANYDLLTAVRADEAQNNGSGGESDSGGDGGQDDAPSIDDLFE